MLRNNAFMDRHALAGMIESTVGCLGVLCIVVGIERNALVVNHDWK
jgi:hypothetical protein